jgi:hypothetical protein
MLASGALIGAAREPRNGFGEQSGTGLLPKLLPDCPRRVGLHTMRKPEFLNHVMRGLCAGCA